MMMNGTGSNQYVNSTKSPMYNRQFSTLHHNNIVNSDG